MINQVVGQSSIQNRRFGEFSRPNPNWYLVNTETEEQKQKKHGKKVVLYALAAGFGILALMKGVLPKTTTKYLEKLRIKLEQKANGSGKLAEFYRFTIKGIDSFMKKSESINNLTSLKDVLFQKLMFGKNGQRTFTRKIHEKITYIFNKLSRSTVNTTYAKTHRKFASLNEYMLELNDRILREHAKDPKAQEAIRIIKERMQRVNTGLENGFGINARNKRLEEMEKATDGLFDYFWSASFGDARNFRSKHMYQSFIAEDYMLPFKLKTSSQVGTLRQLITHDINDSYKATIKALDNLQKFVKPTDVETYEIITALRNNLRKYKKLAGKNELAQRTELNKEISKNLKRLSETFRSEAREEGYTNEAVSIMSRYIEEVENIISNDRKGELQEILTAYKPYLSRKEYLKLKSKCNSAVQSLDKSIDTEIVQYTDKARDLKLGSAPTDVLSILATVGTVGWFLGKSKDKDERISASLKYGIPAIGAIATSLFSTARLVSGGKSIALGLISGWIMNIIGTKVDEARKIYSLDVSLQNKTIAKVQSDK